MLKGFSSVSDDLSMEWDEWNEKVTVPWFLAKAIQKIIVCQLET